MNENSNNSFSFSRLSIKIEITFSARSSKKEKCRNNKKKIGDGTVGENEHELCTGKRPIWNSVYLMNSYQFQININQCRILSNGNYIALDVKGKIAGKLKVWNCG